MVGEQGEVEEVCRVIKTLVGQKLDDVMMSDTILRVVMVGSFDRSWYRIKGFRMCSASILANRQSCLSLGSECSPTHVQDKFYSSIFRMDGTLTK